MGIYVAVVFTIILVVLAIGSALVCLKQASKTADLRYAMVLVKKFMISKDPSYENKDDVETIFDADRIAGELAALALLLNELEDEIAGIRYRLNHDWMAHKDAIYLFVSRAKNWHEAVKNCVKEKAKLIHIEKADEEDFIEKVVYGRHSFYWLGAIKKSDKWRWVDDNSEVKLSFWAEGLSSTGYPTPENPNCIRINIDCTTPRKCWTDLKCNLLGRSICKMKPLKKWIN